MNGEVDGWCNLPVSFRHARVTLASHCRNFYKQTVALGITAGRSPQRAPVHEAGLRLRRSVLRGTLDVVDDQRLNQSPGRFQSEAELLRNRGQEAGLGGIIGAAS